ncbi:hypothetical protein PJI17_20190, partial [Mycobacterium kansasii]
MQSGRSTGPGFSRQYTLSAASAHSAPLVHTRRRQRTLSAASTHSAPRGGAHRRQAGSDRLAPSHAARRRA